MNGAGVKVMDLCFYRCLINLMVAFGTVTINKKHLLNDLPNEHRKIVLFRCILGLLGFTSIVYSIDNLPLFIVTTVFNTTPFWTGLIAFYFLGDTVSKFEIFFMAGSFTGVVALALAKSGILEGINPL
jgi:drug/metabolite transporter (DMT)-like permease